MKNPYLVRIDKWHKDIHSSTDKNVDWRNVFQAANTCTTSSKLIDFNFRFLHRRLPTNSYLQKIGVKEDGKCTFCHDEKEDLTHLFWKCQKTKNFSDNFSIWLQSCQILQPGSYLNMTTAFGLTPDSSSFKLHITRIFILLSPQRKPKKQKQKHKINVKVNYR